MANKNKHILVVEDEAAVSLDIQARLEKAGYFVPNLAYSGEEAVKYTAGTRPDLVLMDINLGKGINGIEAAKIIRQNFNIPVVFLTAYTDDNTVREALQTNPYGYIAKPLKDEDLTLGLQMAFHQYELEKALRSSEEKYRELVESIEEGICQVDENEQFVFLNTAAARIFGSTSDEIIGKNLSEFMTAEDFREVQEKTQERRAGKSDAYEINIVSLDGTNRSIQLTASPRFDEKGTFRGAFSIMRDVTLRKKQEKQIKKLSQAVEQSSSSIVITDADGVVEYVNPAFKKITGYDSSEVVGKVHQVLKPVEKPTDEYRLTWQSLASGSLLQGEFFHAKKNGELYWELTSMAPLLDETGNITNYVSVSEDITVRKKAEQALRESEQKLRDANATKDKLLSIIAHDLRNAFNVILAGSHLLSEEIEFFDKAKISRMAYQLEESAENSHKLLENLLTWALMQMDKIDYKPRQIKLYQIVELNFELFSHNAEAKGVRLKQSIPDELVVFADYDMLNTVIRNLVNNAVKFTGKCGTVQVYSSDGADDEWIEVSVADSGIGIQAEFLPEIFRVDSRYKQKGTAGEKGMGFGLPLCKEFVEKIGGEIRVESEFGKGCTFTFSLPKAGGTYQKDWEQMGK